MQHFWSSASLPEAVRDEIARTFVRYVAPSLTLINLASIVLVYALQGLKEPSRFLPNVPVLVTLPIAFAYTLRQRWLIAAKLLMLGLIGATSAGVLLNSVLTPIYAGNLILLPLMPALFGARRSILFVFWIALSGGMWFWLDSQRLSAGLYHPKPTLAYGLMCLYGAIGLVFAYVPHRLMVDALLQATRHRAALEEEQQAFSAVFEQAAVLLALLQPDGQVVRLNRAAREALRLSEGGFAFAEAPWWTPDARARVLEMLPRAQRGQAIREELALPDRSGRPRIFHLTLSPSLGERGELRYLLAQATEITAQVQTRERLHHAQRLESLGQLSGGVAHDFNNLLGAILASSQLMELALDSGDRPQADELLHAITEASLRASELTRKLLAFGRRERMTTARFDLNELLQETVALLRRTLGASIQITLSPSPSPIELEGDRGALENALINLGVNARDALQGAGELALQATWLAPADPRPACWPAHLPADADMAWIEVRDNGVGMDQATQARIFEPFFTTKALGAGTGLGLPAVLGTMESHQGAVTVQSAPGAGTTFHLFLPCASRRAPSSASLPQISEEDSPRFQGRLLLVDDEALLRVALARTLQSFGFEVYAATGAQEALALIDRGDPFDMALLDVVMPQMGGVELAAALKARRPDLKIAFVSGFSQEELPGGGHGEAARLLRKPFTRRALIDFLREHLPEAQVSGASAP